MPHLIITTAPFPPPEAAKSWQGVTLPAGAPGLWHPRRTHFDALWACTHGTGSIVIRCCLVIDSFPLDSEYIQDLGEWDGKTLLPQFEPFGYFRPLTKAKDPFP